MRRLYLILVALIFAGSVSAETVAQASAKLRARSVAIDTRRFDTLTLRYLFDQAQEWIATKGLAIQAETSYVVSASVYRYSVPGRFYVVASAELNPDPRRPVSNENPPQILKYTPPNEPFFDATGSGRPQRYQIWQRQVKLDKLSITGRDTLRLQYFASATPLVGDSSTFSLPDAWLPLLRDLTFQLCLARIQLAPAPTEEAVNAAIKEVQALLLGRRSDEKE